MDWCCIHFTPDVEQKWFILQVALRPLNTAEFASAASTLADMGLLSLGKGKEERLRRVTLQVHADDVVLALQGFRLFRSIMALE